VVPAGISLQYLALHLAAADVTETMCLRLAETFEPALVQSAVWLSLHEPGTATGWATFETQHVSVPP
jgi:hypothetical protein